jgi:hypothetical protein
MLWISSFRALWPIGPTHCAPLVSQPFEALPAANAL